MLEAEGRSVRGGLRLRRRRAPPRSSSPARPPTPARRRWMSVATPAWPRRRPRSRSSASPASTAASARPGSSASSPGSSPRSPAAPSSASTSATRTPAPLEEMLSAALAAAASAADEHRCVLGGEPVWRIEPIPFDPELVASARRRRLAAGAAAGTQPLTSGALHDAAELARRIPVAMIFVASREGISHAQRGGQRRGGPAGRDRGVRGPRRPGRSDPATPPGAMSAVYNPSGLEEEGRYGRGSDAVAGRR